MSGAGQRDDARNLPFLQLGWCLILKPSTKIFQEMNHKMIGRVCVGFSRFRPAALVIHADCEFSKGFPLLGVYVIASANAIACMITTTVFDIPRLFITETGVP